MTPRSWLFVPGDRPDRMEKALASGADALILDLEDSVAGAAKPAAREAVRTFLQAFGSDRHRLWVRINPVSTPFGLADIEAVAPTTPAGLILPKATPDAVGRMDELLEAQERAHGLEAGATRLLPIATETPAAVLAVSGYADRAARLFGLTWGAEDLSAAVGAATARDEAGRYTPLYDLARSLTLLAAAAAGLPAVETVYPDFRDLEGLSAYAARGRRDGFAGMMAIHPSQVAVINSAFTPSAAEIAAAQRIVALFEAEGGAGVVSLDGRMLDAPHLAQARRVLQHTPRMDPR